MLPVPAAPTAGQAESLHIELEMERARRDVADILYGDLPHIRQRSFDTVPGQAEYAVNDVSLIHELWVERSYRHMAARLDVRVATELARHRVLGFPTCFAFGNSNLWLYPTPNAVYEIGFIQDEAPHQHLQRGADYIVAFSVNNSKAEQKAIELLKEWLTPHQRRDYDTWGWFCVKGNVTNKKYKIHPRSTFNVKELNNKNERVRSLCFVPSSAHAIGDIMLAQKIMLEQREDEALNIANFSNGTSPIPRSTLAAELRAITRRAIRNLTP